MTANASPVGIWIAGWLTAIAASGFVGAMLGYTYVDLTGWSCLLDRRDLCDGIDFLFPTFAGALTAGAPVGWIVLALGLRKSDHVRRQQIGTAAMVFGAAPQVLLAGVALSLMHPDTAITVETAGAVVGPLAAAGIAVASAWIRALRHWLLAGVLTGLALYVAYRLWPAGLFTLPVAFMWLSASASYLSARVTRPEAASARRG